MRLVIPRWLYLVAMFAGAGLCLLALTDTAQYWAASLLELGIAILVAAFFALLGASTFFANHVLSARPNRPIWTLSEGKETDRCVGAVG
jgi:hypothetical protein